MGEPTVLFHQLRDLSHKAHTRGISKSNLLLPIVIGVEQRVVFAVVFPSEDLLDEVHLCVDIPVGVIGMILRITRIKSFRYD